MSLDNMLAVFGILMAAAWTPGPNNMMLAASGVNYGLRATVPHIFGVFIGFSFMIFSISLGLGSLFLHYPLLQEILRWGGALMLVWVAWKIASAKRPGEAGGVTSATGWAWFGMMLARWLHTPARLHAFNWTMAAIILAGVAVVLFADL